MRIVVLGIKGVVDHGHTRDESSVGETKISWNQPRDKTFLRGLNKLEAGVWYTPVTQNFHGESFEKSVTGRRPTLR